jgi:hypothetical protein
MPLGANQVIAVSPAAGTLLAGGRPPMEFRPFGPPLASPLVMVLLTGP